MTIIAPPIEKTIDFPKQKRFLNIPEHQRLPTQPQMIEVDVDYLKTCHVIFAIPCYGGQCYEGLVGSFINWSTAAQQLGMEWGYISIGNESLVSRARNTLVSKFLTDHPTATHLMFVDSDITFWPWQIISLLQRQQDITGGLYSLKQIPSRWCANGVANAERLDEHCEEVLTVGTGFMLIKRDVFIQLRSHPDVVQYANDIGMDKKYDANMWTYFDCEVRDGRYLSEDWLFCLRWRDQGGKIWADRRVVLPHTGTYIYGRDDNRLINEYGPRYVKELKSQGYTLRDVYGAEINLDLHK